MKHGSLFSGIGGFDLAAEWMGWDNVFHCEWNEFGQRVLKHYWPKAISYEDITKTDFTIHRGQLDILTGGFPCQPYSQAGKRLGKEDERHLWPEMLRTIREIQPRWVVGENVFGLVNWSGGLVFEEVQADLEAEGYEVQPYVLPAAAVNAPHRRDRVWFVAYRNSNGGQKHSESVECKGRTEKGGGHKFTIGANDNGTDGLTTNPNSGGLEGAKEVGWDSINVERQSEFRLTSDTDSNGLHERYGNDEVYTGQGRLNAQRDADESNGNGDVADTNGSRIQGQQQYSRNTSENRQGWKNFKENGHNGYVRAWQNFPTQPPVRDGNDGISTQLDTITFSKWRNESIKAGGNAIVPQVALQIFKAIEDYERMA